MPRRAAVPMTERTAAKRSAPQSERKPPVTLRYVAVGRSSRSLPLLSAATSGWSRKVNRWSRTLPYRLRKALTMSVCGSERHDGIKRAIQPSAVFAPCALGQIAAAPGNHHGAQQQRLDPRGEDGIPGLDGEL